MSNAKSTSRSIYIDSTSAQQALDQLTKKAATLQVAIDGGTLSGDKLNKKIKELATNKR
jgi:predicted exporter